MTCRKRILVLESENLISASILSLLASQSRFDVINAPVSSIASLEKPDSIKPDVVILEEEQLATNITAVINLAEYFPTLRLIVFNQKNNTLHIFDKQMIQVRHINDLLNLL